MEITFFACIANYTCETLSFIVALSLSLQETLTHPSLPKEISCKCAISLHHSILCYFTVALDSIFLKEQSVEITFFACIANSPFCHNFPVI